MTSLLASLNAGHLIAWSIVGVFALSAVVALFQKATSDARRAEARKTGDPENLTLEDRRANREEFVRELATPRKVSDAKACWILGLVLLAAGGLGSLVFETGSLPGLAVGGGVVFMLLGLGIAFANPRGTR